MIIFKKIFAQNFMSIGSAGIEVDFVSAKKTLVIGKNGSGKSIIFTDGISFALFGKPFRNINKNQLINSINDKGCLVEIEFSIASDEYKVIRGIRPSIFEIHKNGVLVNQDSSTRDYQKVLEQQILGMSYRVFTQVVILGSATFTPFMQLPLAARREVIEDILDIKIFSQMNSLLKDKISSTKQQLESIEHSITLSTERAKAQKKLIQTITANNKKLSEDKQNQLDKFSNELSEIEENIKKLDSDIEKMESMKLDIDSTEMKDSLAIEKKNKILAESEVERKQREIVFFEKNDVCHVCSQTIAEDHRHEMTSEAKNIVQSRQSLLESINEKISRLEKQNSKLKTMNEALSSFSSRLKVLNKTKDILLKSISELNNQQLVDLGVLENEREQLTNIANEALRHLSTKENLLKQKSVHDFASILLKDTGIRTTVVDAFIPVINKMVNNYLNIMNLFISFNLDNNFNEVLLSRHRDNFTYSSFSEGEKARINVALLLCWRHISKLKNSAATNLLVMDEILDSAVDEEGLHSLMQLIDSLEGNIFVISHRGEMTERFDNILEFQKINDYTTLKVGE